MKFWRQFGRVLAGTLDAVIAYERKKAYNNRMRKVIDGEEKNINRAYIALGKHYYRNLRQASPDEAAKLLCRAIDESRAREQAARRLLQITIQGKRHAGAVAVIGGAGGPTAVFVARTKEKRPESQNHWNKESKP